MALSGILKQHGHTTDVLINAYERDIVSQLKMVKPDIIGFLVRKAY